MQIKRIIRAFSVAALVVMIAVTAAACGENKAAPASESGQTASQAAAAADKTEAGDAGSDMTETYRAGRQAYYDLTGIWMPEAAGFEAEYDANYEHKSIAFDSHGDRALFEGAKAALTEALGEPDNSDEISAYWARHNEDDTAVLNYEVYYHETESDGIWVYMNFFTQAIDG